MIYGIGIDIVDVRRVGRLLKRFPLRFPHRILHPAERLVYGKQHDKAGYLARQFAAKEAIGKALGRGFRDGCYPGRILVERDKAGCPVVSVPKIGADMEFKVSIADEKNYVVAQALAIKSSPHA